LPYHKKQVILNAAIVQQAAGQLQNNDNHSNSSIVNQAGGLIQPNQNPIVQQAVGQLHPTSILCKILWGHHLTILGKSATIQEALDYLKQTLQNNWSRSILELQIESKLIERQGKAVNNFQPVQVFPKLP
jgi:hypothetical protein